MGQVVSECTTRSTCHGTCEYLQADNQAITGLPGSHTTYSKYSRTPRYPLCTYVVVPSWYSTESWKASYSRILYSRMFPIGQLELLACCMHARAQLARPRLPATAIQSDHHAACRTSPSVGLWL
jgi:hypothetical protein